MRCSHLSGLVILSDYLNKIGSEKPPRIDGYSPDVYACDVPITTKIIGEAKTGEDITRPHSRDQIRAYLEHLRYQPKGFLVLAVPCFFAASARIVVENARRVTPVQAGEVEVIVLEGFGE
jgi:hypothetical protein